MTDIIKIIGAAFLTAITTIVLKTTKPELSFAVLIAGTVIILLFLVDLLQGAFTAFSSIVAMTGMENGLQQHIAALLQTVLDGHGGGDNEVQGVGVELVVTAVDEGDVHIGDLPAKPALV